jgi:hypothetical protein
LTSGQDFPVLRRWRTVRGTGLQLDRLRPAVAPTPSRAAGGFLGSARGSMGYRPPSRRWKGWCSSGEVRHLPCWRRPRGPMGPMRRTTHSCVGASARIALTKQDKGEKLHGRRALGGADSTSHGAAYRPIGTRRKLPTVLKKIRDIHKFSDQEVPCFDFRVGGRGRA